jgi:hypothetical protein
VRNVNVKTILVKNRPLQVLQCDNCGFELRPGYGRGADIINAPNFKCFKCGANGTHFFDKENESDPRSRGGKSKGFYLGL